MSRHVRKLAVGLGVLSLGLWFLAAGGQGVADDKADVRAAVQKVADAVEKGDADTAKKLAEEIAKDQELENVMYLMKKRDSKGKAKGYFGVGKQPGAIKPDGIEDKTQNLGKRPLEQKQLDKESDALAEMAYRIAAIAEIAKAKPGEKADNDKKKKEWAEYAETMRKEADALADAAKTKKPAEIKAAANKIYSTCNNCHGSFRD